MSDAESIKALARKCARGNLNLAQAVAVFDTLYAADAIMLSQGNQTKAAERSGCTAPTLYRMLKRRRSEE